MLNKVRIFEVWKKYWNLNCSHSVGLDMFWSSSSLRIHTDANKATHCLPVNISHLPGMSMLCERTKAGHSWCTPVIGSDGVYIKFCRCRPTSDCGTLCQPN